MRNEKLILETPQLLLRELTADDAGFAYRLNLDPEVVQYTGDGPFESEKAAGEFLQRYEHYQKFGFGRWGVVRKEDGELLGWCGLKYTAEDDEHDIGFRFFKRHWGKGYATESAMACLRLGFTHFNMPFIVGRARVENKASIRVLQKIGLDYFSPFDFDGHAGVIYRLDIDNYKP